MSVLAQFIDVELEETYVRFPPLPDLVSSRPLADLHRPISISMYIPESGRSRKNNQFDKLMSH